MEEDIVEEILKEIVEENKALFLEEELKLIKNNVKMVKKIYLLGLINAREIYGKSLQ